MANEYLKRTPTSTGNRKVWTLALWLKRNITDGDTGADAIFNAANTAANSHGTDIRFRKDNPGIGNWNFYDYNANAFDWGHYGTVARRDNGNWFHAIFVFDSVQSSPRNRIEVYINGVLDNNYNSSPNIDPSINYESYVNSITAHYLGVDQLSGSLTTSYSKSQFADVFLVDGQALTPDVFGFYKDGDGYMSSGTTQATDFRPGQWSPRLPKSIKHTINRSGGFGVNGFYLPMNDSSNFGADFHCDPNSIIKLKGENLPQPRNGAPETTDAYVSQLRTDPYAANLVLAVPGISTATGANLVTNGTFEPVADGETGYDNGDGTVDGWNKNSIGSLSITSGSTVRALRVSQPSANPGVTYGQGSISLGTLTSGKRYLLKYSGLGGTAKKYPAICTDANTSNTNGTFVGLVAQIGAYSTAAEEVQKYFQPSSTAEHWLVLQLGNDGAGTYHDFDNIVVVQEDAPRDYSADIKGSGTNKTLTANGNAGVGYGIPSYYGSAMIFDGTGDHFRTTSSLTDFQFGTGDFTVEAWIFKSAQGSDGYDGVISLGGSGSATDGWFFEASDTRGIIFACNADTVSSPNTLDVNNSQWSHIVAERYNGVTTLYYNGVAIATNTSIGSVPTNGTFLDIGGSGLDGAAGTGEYYFNGKIQDVRIYKGVAKYKGGFDVPKPYTPVGIATWRAVPDTTANNFTTMNPLIGATQRSGAIDSTIVNYTDGNLTTRNSANAGYAPQMQSHSNVGMTTGKWYWEVSNFSTTTNEIFGISKGNEQGSPTGNGVGIESLISFNSSVGTIYIAGQSDTTGSITPASGTISNIPGNAISSISDVVGFAFDADNSSLTVYLNGTLNNTVTNIVPTARSVDKPWRVTKSASGSGSPSGMSWNFGQNPTFSGQVTAGTNTDGNGKGLFKYAPPSGFLALCEDNLPTPAISDPGEHFKTVLYTGDGNSGRSITGVGFKPDLVWIKNRANGVADSWHSLSNSVTPGRLFSNETTAEDPFKDVGSFDDNGMTINYGSYVNTNGGTYVAWCWKAGGAAVSNTDGTIASQVSVNQTAGFSIVSYTGTAANATVGHGLGVAPKMMIFKGRFASNWTVYHNSLPAPTTSILILNSTGAAVTSLPSYWNSTAPTSTVFSLSTDTNVNSTNAAGMIAYCWAEIEGYSKFGSYVGNGDPDGPAIFCGFKPAWVMVKRSDVADDWIVVDSSRSPLNGSNLFLYPNLAAEDAPTNIGFDLLSNGFKLRGSIANRNASGGTFIFMAFAESPFQTANAK